MKRKKERNSSCLSSDAKMYTCFFLFFFSVLISLLWSANCKVYFPIMILSQSYKTKMKAWCVNNFMHMFFSDRNECVIDNGGCEQTCQNTVGSRYCLCTQDYVAVGNVCFGKCMIRPLFSFCSQISNELGSCVSG